MLESPAPGGAPGGGTGPLPTGVLPPLECEPSLGLVRTAAQPPTGARGPGFALSDVHRAAIHRVGDLGRSAATPAAVRAVSALDGARAVAVQAPRGPDAVLPVPQ